MSINQDTSTIHSQASITENLLLRFHCGLCHFNTSKLIKPELFTKTCQDCFAKCCLVVIRCTESLLLGGYICTSCDNKFLSRFPFGLLSKVTPVCYYCGIKVKLYQALLNRSKVSVKNIKEFACLSCGGRRDFPYFRISGKGDRMICCGAYMKYMKLRREFRYIRLEGNKDPTSRRIYFHSINKGRFRGRGNGRRAKKGMKYGEFTRPIKRIIEKESKGENPESGYFESKVKKATKKCTDDITKGISSVLC